MKKTLSIFYLLDNNSPIHWRILDVAGFSDPMAVASTYWREFHSALRHCIFFTLLKEKLRHIEGEEQTDQVRGRGEDRIQVFIYILNLILGITLYS